MEIKRTEKSTFEPPKKTESVESKSPKFEGKLRAAGADVPSPTSPAVSALKSRFSKSDLEDSAKLDSILNSAVRELMVDQLPQAQQLGEADKQFLTNWMLKDPLILGRLMNLLKNILD